MHKPSLLYLCHRIPYPPNKGDKIRSWHLLKYLVDRYDVFLGTFVDDPQDWEHVPYLRRLCAGTYFAPLNARVARIGSATALLNNKALSLPYYRNAGLRRWAGGISDENDIDRRVVFSSVMGQFLPERVGSSRTLVDFVDVDSDKWRQYASSRKGLSAWIYRREARLLEHYEQSLARRCDAALFVSEAEAAFFRDRTGGGAAHCGFFSNGVDASFFDPAETAIGTPGDRELRVDSPELVFTGAMDYWPNIDAVNWFARDVLPLLREEIPELRFTIVGGKPSPAVLELEALPGVTVTGRVPDVRPYLARAMAAVAPMRVARGVQNKVLEAMAMAKPVLVSAMGLEGIDAQDRESVLIANEPAEYRSALRSLVRGEAPQLGERARSLVLERYAWESCLAKVSGLLEASP